MKNRVTRVDCIAVVTGVTEVVPCGNRGGVGSSKCREQRMAVREIDTVFLNPGERRSVYLIDRPVTKPVGHKNHNIADRMPGNRLSHNNGNGTWQPQEHRSHIDECFFHSQTSTLSTMREVRILPSSGDPQ